MKSRRWPRNDTREAWVLDQSRSVAKVVDLLANLVEELGVDLAFSPAGPEISLVRNVLRIAHESGGAVALDAVRWRLQSHLAEDDLDPDGDVMSALACRIVDIGGRP